MMQPKIVERNVARNSHLMASNARFPRFEGSLSIHL